MEISEPLAAKKLTIRQQEWSMNGENNENEK